MKQREPLFFAVVLLVLALVGACMTLLSLNYHSERQQQVVSYGRALPPVSAPLMPVR